MKGDLERGGANGDVCGMSVDPDAVRLVPHMNLGARTVPVPFWQRRCEP